MANTQHNVRENVRELHDAPQPQDEPSKTPVADAIAAYHAACKAHPEEAAALDHAAWLAAAAMRKFKVDDDNVWVYADGRLLSVPALAGLASLPESVRPFVFHATVQFGAYRIGQVAEGDLTKAIDDAFTRGVIPPAKTNDAYRAAYSAEIERLVVAKLGELPKGASAEDKKARRVLIDAYCDKYVSQLFAPTVIKYKANTSRPVTGDKRKRGTTSTVDTSEALI